MFISGAKLAEWLQEDNYVAANQTTSDATTINYTVGSSATVSIFTRDRNGQPINDRACIISANITSADDDTEDDKTEVNLVPIQTERYIPPLYIPKILQEPNGSFSYCNITTSSGDDNLSFEEIRAKVYASKGATAVVKKEVSASSSATTIKAMPRNPGEFIFTWTPRAPGKSIVKITVGEVKQWLIKIFTSK